MHERRNPIAIALELCLSCTNPSKCSGMYHQWCHWHLVGRNEPFKWMSELIDICMGGQWVPDSGEGGWTLPAWALYYVHHDNGHISYIPGPGHPLVTNIFPACRVSNTDICWFIFLSAWIGCWTNNQIASDLRFCDSWYVTVIGMFQENCFRIIPRAD